MSQEIIVVAYPKSGITWLIRLLSDLLHSPQQDTPESDKYYWGPHKDGDYIFRKSHQPYSDSEKGKTVIYLQRDPRDVAVSASKYLDIGIIEAVTEMPLMMPYRDWVNSWRGSYDEVIRYEDVSSDAIAWLVCRIKRNYAIYPAPESEQVIRRHSFSNMQKSLGSHFCRKGIVGDWRNHFTKEIGQEFDNLLGDLMMWQGYIKSRDWWRNF